MRDKLTSASIKSYPIKDKKYLVTDTQTQGLCLEVFPSGTKNFVFRYRIPGAKNAKRITIGNSKSITLTIAKEAIKIHNGNLAKGIDPSEKSKQQKVLESQKRLKNDLKLFNYIEKYYKPYATEHSVTATEIIRTLKNEFEFIAEKSIKEINEHDIDQWRKKKAKKVTFERIDRIYSYLKACINTAVKHYKIIDSFALQNHSLKRKPTEKVNQPKLRYLLRDSEEPALLKALAERDQELREQRTRYIKWHEQRKSKKKKPPPLAEHEHPDHITPIIILLYHTGFDIGDILDLEWEPHIDLRNNQIRKIRNKTKHKMDNPQPVVVPLSNTARAVLEQWGKQHGTTGPLFINPNTKKKYTTIKSAWETIRDNAGLKNFRIKDFRHTFGSWLAISGSSLHEIRDLMGHTDIKTTQIYAHLCPSFKKQSINKAFS